MRVKEVLIELIDVDEQLIREVAEDDALIELAQDIAARGLLQPIGVSVKGDGRFQLLWGCRRLCAYKRLHRETIAANVRVDDGTPVKAVALVENLQRQNLTLTEEVEAIHHLHTVEGRGVEQIAALVSKSRSWVLSRLSVPGLPEFLREPLLDGSLPLSHVEEISRVPHDGAQRLLTQYCIAGRWNRAQLKAAVQAHVENPYLADAQAHGDAVARGEVPIPIITMACEACGEKRPVVDFRLVRVCKDGCRSDKNASGSDSANTGGEPVAQGRRESERDSS